MTPKLLAVLATIHLAHDGDQTRTTKCVVKWDENYAARTQAAMPTTAYVEMLLQYIGSGKGKK